MNAERRGLLAHRKLTERIIGVFYEAYNELGGGFLESVYASAMAIALEQVGLRVEQQSPIPVRFRGVLVGDFRADLLVENCVICELKTASKIEPVFEAQLLNYLKATQIEVGLLLNFGPRPEFKRLVFANSRKTSALIRVDPRLNPPSGPGRREPGA